VAFTGQAAVKSAPPAVRLSYERAANVADCPDREAVLDAVRARLGFDPFREPAEINIRASVFRDGKDLCAQILWSDEGARTSERRLASHRADCAELASAMELALSIAIDPLSIAREPESSTPVPLVTEREAVVVETQALDRVRSRYLDTVAGTSGNVGETVAPTLGFFAGVGLRSEHWSISLEGRADLPRSRSAGGGSIEAGPLAATLAPCVRRGMFGGCALASFEALRGSGHDLSNATQATSLFFTVGARALVEIPLQDSLAVRRGAGFDYQLTYNLYPEGGNSYQLDMYQNGGFGGGWRYSPCPRELQIGQTEGSGKALLVPF
jgi:hypothetical protein